MTIQNLFFDLDDTLLDFGAAERIAISKTLEHLGAAPTDEICRLYSQINLAQWKLLELGKLTRAEVKQRRFTLFFERAGLAGSPEEAAKFYESRLSEGHVFVPGAKELLDSLYGSYRLYVVTNGTARVQEGRMASAGLERYFDGIFISEKLGANKPSTEFFDRCFAKIPSFEKDASLLIGDSLSSDIKGGAGAGLRTVWFNPAHQANNSDVRPDYELAALDELPELLSRLNGRLTV